MWYHGLPAYMCQLNHPTPANNIQLKDRRDFWMVGEGREYCSSTLRKGDWHLKVKCAVWKDFKSNVQGLHMWGWTNAGSSKKTMLTFDDANAPGEGVYSRYRFCHTMWKCNHACISHSLTHGKHPPCDCFLEKLHSSNSCVRMETLQHSHWRRT